MPGIQALLGIAAAPCRLQGIGVRKKREMCLRLLQRENVVVLKRKGRDKYSSNLKCHRLAVFHGAVCGWCGDSKSCPTW